MTGGAAPPPRAARQHVAGVAEALPDGERVLWRGAPRPALLARHAFHVRLVAAYFAATTAWWAARTAPELGWSAALPVLGIKLLLAALVVGLVYGYAVMAARSTEYVVTSRRVVMRVGAVFPVVVNLPLALVTSAGVHRFRDGSGQILLELDRHARVSWWLLWPHVRPARLRWPEPLLRGLTDADAAAAALREGAAALTPAEVEAAVAAAREASAPSEAPAPPARAPRSSARAGGAGTPVAIT